MVDPVTVPLLVPTDRVRDFGVAVGALVAGDQPPDPQGGSQAADWQQVSVVLAPEAVASFYTSYGVWMARATAPAAAAAAFDPQLLEQVWTALPRRERKFLSLCSDNFGRSVGWGEVKRKLGLSGKPSLTRDLPRLAQICTDSARAFPVVQDGKGDDAVFTLPDALVASVRTLRRTEATSATA